MKSISPFRVRILSAVGLATLICWSLSVESLPVGEASAAASASDKKAGKPIPEQISFNAHIRPIMSNTCFTCHGPDEESNDSGFVLDSFEHATSTLPSNDEMVGIKPGKPLQSEVYLRITGRSEWGEQMPPEDFRHQLSERERELFRLWIEQGAEYEEHWSYAPLEEPRLPTPRDNENWIANPIDAFILRRLEEEGLQPSESAGKATLLRRVSLDLTGLPPTVEERQAFLADDSSQAYQRVVERLLNSPHYGERMASFWLDLVRFADTVGFHGDQNQRIFPYRDYVIGAFNDNMPFDQFTREQLAGDLLPEPSVDQLVATGFLRLNMMTREGGAQPGEYFAKYQADRVRTLGTAWLGSTLGCCECHNHKYDPFSTRDFYSFGAFFADLRQWGVYTSYGYTPNPDLSGFSNDHPFPPELRVESESLVKEISQHERIRDQQLLQELGSKTLQTPRFKQWRETMLGHIEKWPSGWTPLEIADVQTSKGTSSQLMNDGSVMFTGAPQKLDVVTIASRVQTPMTVNSVRIEVLPDDEHGGFVGRAKDGRFTVSDLNLSLVSDADSSTVTEKIDNRPQYIRLELPGENRILSLAEVEVFVKGEDGELKNIAPEGKASQSSDYQGITAERAIDGNTNGDFRGANSTTHTNSENNPWWELDLVQPRKIEKIRLWNRTDNNLQDRLNGVQLVLFDNEHRRTLVSRLETPKPSDEFTLPEKVRVQSGPPIKIQWSQADRRNPFKYSNGYEPVELDNGWRSGPARWQLPSNEAQLAHTAVYHFDRPLDLSPSMSLVMELATEDIGRLRLSVTPVGHAKAGWDSIEPKLREALVAPSDSLSEAQEAILVSAFHRSTEPFDRQSNTSKVFVNRLLELRSGFAMSLIAQPLPEEDVPESRVLPRGNWQDRSGKLTPPGFPEFLSGLTADSSGTADKRRLSRLDLANWLTSADNPLTARHFVNRTWSQFFGTGFSAKLDDLGNQGEWPSHPELLDWLATEFIDSGWDVKHIVRLIVTSNTYRQSAAVRNDLADLDPYNRLLSQQSPRRLEAEIVRDNALAISGLLFTDYVGGPSVFPYQPAGHYRDIQFPSRRYRNSDDWRQYRRGVYMHWQRTFLHPMLVNFDAPSRDECTADRPLSNSPQQALTLLNDPTFTEASNAMASELLAGVGIDSVSSFITAAYLRALSREPKVEEIAGLEDLFQEQREYYRNNQDDAIKLLKIGLSKQVTDGDVAELAAYSMVCRVILNLHETITRY